MKRLEAIASFISPYKILADVGCDHGYLIKIAFLRGLITKAYAIDNKMGPLSQAMSNLEDFSNVEYILQDGLKKLNSDCECVVIAGMGGLLITEILSKGLANLKTVKRIIIEANKDSYDVRLFLYHQGYKIIKETIVLEDNKYYEIDAFEKNDGEIYSDDELYFGPLLLKEKPIEFKNKWNELYNKFNNIKQKKDFCKKIEEMLNEDSRAN